MVPAGLFSLEGSLFGLQMVSLCSPGILPLCVTLSEFPLLIRTVVIQVRFGPILIDLKLI